MSTADLPSVFIPVNVCKEKLLEDTSLNCSQDSTRAALRGMMGQDTPWAKQFALFDAAENFCKPCASIQA